MTATISQGIKRNIVRGKKNNQLSFISRQEQTRHGIDNPIYTGQNSSKPGSPRRLPQRANGDKRASLTRSIFTSLYPRIARSLSGEGAVCDKA